MKCAEVHPNLAAFVLGGLEAQEAAEEHVGKGPAPGRAVALKGDMP
jgi:hypothetical protein